MDYAEGDTRTILLKFKAKHSLHGIARMGDIEEAEKLVSRLPEEVNSLNKFGESPLHVASIFGQGKCSYMCILCWTLTRMIKIQKKQK